MLSPMLHIGLDLGYTSPCLCIKNQKNEIIWYVMPQRNKDLNFLVKDNTYCTDIMNDTKINIPMNNNLHSSIPNPSPSIPILNLKPTLKISSMIPKEIITYQNYQKLAEHDKLYMVTHHINLIITTHVHAELVHCNELTIRINIEGYSMGSTGKALNMLTELGGAIKYNIFDLENKLKQLYPRKHIILKLYCPSPSRIKKQFTNNGRASKYDMLCAFLQDSTIHIPSLPLSLLLHQCFTMIPMDQLIPIVLEQKKVQRHVKNKSLDVIFSKKPLQDIVDSYAIMLTKDNTTATTIATTRLTKIINKKKKQKMSINPCELSINMKTENCSNNQTSLTNRKRSTKKRKYSSINNTGEYVQSKHNNTLSLTNKKKNT